MARVKQAKGPSDGKKRKSYKGFKKLGGKGTAPPVDKNNEGKAKRHFRPSTLQLRGIRRTQKSTIIFLNKSNLNRCFRYWVDQYAGNNQAVRVGDGVVKMLAWALQDHLVDRTRKAYHVSLHGSGKPKKTLTAKLYNAVNNPPPLN